MRRKVWRISPIFFIIVIAMFAISIFSWLWNIKVFYAEIVLSIVCFVVVLIGIVNFKSYVHSIIKNSLKLLTGVNQDVLEKYSTPVAVLGKQGDIVWFNSSFKKSIAINKDCIGESAFQFFSEGKLESILDNTSENLMLGDKHYTVFGAEVVNAIVLYFIDNTYYKKIADEYDESRPAVAFIMFDNKEELERETGDGEDTRVSITVENTLQKWASSSHGFLKKLNNGRYIMILEERYLKQITNSKFKILEDIRNIKIDNRKCATISIGVGKGGKDLKESEHWARMALDMALGRGGDQVAVKCKDEYKFFGGVSKGIEKRYKVRSRVIASTLSDQIKSSDCVLIMGHRFSDLDSVGAAVGMFSASTKGQNKKSYIVINKKQSLAKSLIDSIEKSAEEEVFISPERAKGIITDKTLLIIVDTHSKGFVEDSEVYNMAKRVIVIDHHRMMVNHINNAVVFYHEPYASSASEMVAELVQYLGDDDLDRLEAEALLAGIMLDTKNFVLKTGVRTFEAAAYLRRKGADTVEVKRLFSNSIDTYKAKYQLVSEAEIFNNCAIASADETGPEVRLAAAQAADELLGIQDVRASFVMFVADDEINISSRSLGDVNVQLIMEAMGGGGHQTMAGTQIKGKTMAEVREHLVQIISELEIKNK